MMFNIFILLCLSFSAAVASAASFSSLKEDHIPSTLNVDNTFYLSAIYGEVSYCKDKIINHKTPFCSTTFNAILQRRNFAMIELFFMSYFDIKEVRERYIEELKNAVLINDDYPMTSSLLRLISHAPFRTIDSTLQGIFIESVKSSSVLIFKEFLLYSDHFSLDSTFLGHASLSPRSLCVVYNRKDLIKAFDESEMSIINMDHAIYIVIFSLFLLILLSLNQQLDL